MYCPNCGRQSPPSSRFCISCGDPLRPACNACGADVRAGDRFCGSCGSRLAPGEIATHPAGSLGGPTVARTEPNPFERIKFRSLFIWELVSIPVGLAIFGGVHAIYDLDLGDPTVTSVGLSSWFYGSILLGQAGSSRSEISRWGASWGGCPEVTTGGRSSECLWPRCCFRLARPRLFFTACP